MPACLLRDLLPEGLAGSRIVRRAPDSQKQQLAVLGDQGLLPLIGALARLVHEVPERAHLRERQAPLLDSDDEGDRPRLRLVEVGVVAGPFRRGVGVVGGADVFVELPVRVLLEGAGDVGIPDERVFILTSGEVLALLRAVLADLLPQRLSNELLAPAQPEPLGDLAGGQDAEEAEEYRIEDPHPRANLDRQGRRVGHDP